MGLAIVKHVVEAQGGRISVESPGEGKGATFTVVFEALTAGATESTGRFAFGPRPERGALAGVRVLVVEDDPDARLLVTRVLLEAQAEVCDVADAASALDALDRFVPQVVVSDIGMPGVDRSDCEVILPLYRSMAPARVSESPRRHVRVRAVGQGAR